MLTNICFLFFFGSNEAKYLKKYKIEVLKCMNTHQAYIIYNREVYRTY